MNEGLSDDKKKKKKIGRFWGLNKFRDNRKQDNKKPSTGQNTASTSSTTSKKSTFKKRQTRGERKQSLAKGTCLICKKSGHMANKCLDKKDKTETTKSKDVKKVKSGGKNKVNKIIAVAEDKYAKEPFRELVDDSDIQARYPPDNVSIFFPISLNLIY